MFEFRCASRDLEADRPSTTLTFIRRSHAGHGAKWLFCDFFIYSYIYLYMFIYFPYIGGHVNANSDTCDDDPSNDDVGRTRSEDEAAEAEEEREVVFPKARTLFTSC